MLKIKDNVDLKELEKFGFSKEIKDDLTHSSVMHIDSPKDYYEEIIYINDNGLNTIEILEERKNSDWIHNNRIREIYTYPNDYDIGISRKTLETIYDLIIAGLVEKVEE